jgi:alanyl aminopeptidase
VILLQSGGDLTTVPTLDLVIVPEHDSGDATIELELDRPVRTIWLHGRSLDVSRVSIDRTRGEKIEARWEPAQPEGPAAVRLSESVGPGRATLRIAYDAAPV